MRRFLIQKAKPKDTMPVINQKLKVCFCDSSVGGTENKGEGLKERLKERADYYHKIKTTEDFSRVLEYMTELEAQ